MNRSTFKVMLVTVLMLSASALAAQDRVSRGYLRRDIDDIHDEIRKLYFDSTFGGVDFSRLYKEARSEVNSVQSYQQGMALIARMLAPLNDSHTYFLPRVTGRISYGFGIKFFGEIAYVTDVLPGSDADVKGLKTGDRVLIMNGSPVVRSNFHDVTYQHYLVAPQKVMSLVVTTPDGVTRQLGISAKVEDRIDFITWNPSPLKRAKIAAADDTLRHYTAHRYATFGNKAFLWRLPGFWADDRNIRKMAEKAIPFEALILDLRGNSGGSVETLKVLVSSLVNFETDIAIVRERTKIDTVRVKPAKRTFTGRVFVLVDSESASASEVLARLMQLLGRGTVVGDRTAGAVRASVRRMNGRLSVSISDIVMSDGGRLEGEGVQPNEMVLMKAYDLVEGQDPVLWHALTLAGVEITAKDAGRIYNSATLID